MVLTALVASCYLYWCWYRRHGDLENMVMGNASGTDGDNGSCRDSDNSTMVRSGALSVPTSSGQLSQGLLQGEVEEVSVSVSAAVRSAASI